MDTKKLDLNLLVTLEALLAEQNVTRAAERLHLSQPAVSTQLSRLRTLFDDPLLIPTQRGMTSTAKAQELLDPLRFALDQVRATSGHGHPMDGIPCQWVGHTGRRTRSARPATCSSPIWPCRVPTHPWAHCGCRARGHVQQAARNRATVGSRPLLAGSHASLIGLGTSPRDREHRRRRLSKNLSTDRAVVRRVQPPDSCQGCHRHRRRRTFHLGCAPAETGSGEQLRAGPVAPHAAHRYRMPVRRAARGRH